MEATGESLRHRPPLVAGPLSEMDKDLSSPRVKIDRPVVPFRGKFIGCPYRSLPFRSRTISYEIGGKFYKWNSSATGEFHSVRGNLPTLGCSLDHHGFFPCGGKKYGNGMFTMFFSTFSLIIVGLISRYIRREEIFEFRYFLFHKIRRALTN